ELHRDRAEVDRRNVKRFLGGGAQDVVALAWRVSQRARLRYHRAAAKQRGCCSGEKISSVDHGFFPLRRSPPAAWWMLVPMPQGTHSDLSPPHPRPEEPWQTCHGFRPAPQLCSSGSIGRGWNSIPSSASARASSGLASP